MRINKLLILVDGETPADGQELTLSVVTQDIQPRLQEWVNLPSSVQVVTPEALSAQLARGKGSAAHLTAPETLIYPLTANLPAALSFPGQSLFSLCRNEEQLRQQVQGWGYGTGTGNFWLPIALTAKGPLYGEVIGYQNPTETWGLTEIARSPVNKLVQPVHLDDRWRQPLYQLGYQLLHSIAATPATYLVQFGWQDQQLCFDRLWPFPTQAAIASMGVQAPDLFECHWRCLAGLPIMDLKIAGHVDYIIPPV